MARRVIEEGKQHGGELGLTLEESAFYNALEVNDSAVKVLGDEALRTVAPELLKAVRANVKVDWTVRGNVRAYVVIP